MTTHWFTQTETLSRFGCAIGSLCQELSKQGGQMAASSSVLLTDIIQWVKKQFSALGKDEEQASHLAEYFVSTLQGTFLLAATFKEPRFLERQNKILEEWLVTV
jgi:TetR/AcrR family transcriptional repressor of nem operon